MKIRKFIHLVLYNSKAELQSESSRTYAGYLWWILDARRTVAGYYASGYLNTDVYVFKKYDVVIVRTQAPRNGFTGRDESGDYFSRAMSLFKKIVNER